MKRIFAVFILCSIVFGILSSIVMLLNFANQPSQKSLALLETEYNSKDCERYYEKAKEVLKNGTAIGQTGASSAYSLLYQSCLMREALKNVEKVP